MFVPQLHLVLAEGSRDLQEVLLRNIKDGWLLNGCTWQRGWSLEQLTTLEMAKQIFVSKKVHGAKCIRMWIYNMDEAQQWSSAQEKEYGVYENRENK